MGGGILMSELSAGLFGSNEGVDKKKQISNTSTMKHLFFDIRISFNILTLPGISIANSKDLWCLLTLDLDNFQYIAFCQVVGHM